HVEDEVVPLVDGPRERFGVLDGRRPRLPEQKVRLRVEAPRLELDLHPAEADIRILAVELARGAETVHQNIGVMDDLGVAGQDLERSDVAPTLDRHREDEVAEEVRAASTKRVRLRKLEDEVRLAEEPAVREGGDGRQLRGIALARSPLHPARDS